MSAPTDPQDAAANQRLANRVESATAGHLDAQKLIFAIRGGGDAAELLQQSITHISSLHDVDRLNAFSRSLARAIER